MGDQLNLKLLTLRIKSIEETLKYNENVTIESQANEACSFKSRWSNTRYR